MSVRPDRRSESRQHPAAGRSTIDGPGPPTTARETTGPIVCDPAMRWARMRKSDIGRYFEAGKEPGHGALLFLRKHAIRQER